MVRPSRRVSSRQTAVGGCMYSTVQYSPTSKRARQPGANFPPKDSGWRALSSPAHRLQHNITDHNKPYQKPYRHHTIPYHTIPYPNNIISLSSPARRLQHTLQLSTPLKNPGDTVQPFEIATRQLIQTLILVLVLLARWKASTEHIFANTPKVHLCVNWAV